MSPTHSRTERFRTYLAGLTPDERWAHCGSSKLHLAHTHTVCFSGETPNPNVPCVGTPRLHPLASSDPQTEADRAELLYLRTRLRVAEEVIEELRPVVEALAGVQWGDLLRRLRRFDG